MSDTQDNKKGLPKGKAALIVAIAIGVVVVASLIPWESISGGKMKDFNLVSDILKDDNSSDSVGDGAVEEDIEEMSQASVASTVSGSVVSPTFSDSVAERTLPPRKPSRQGDLTLIEDYTLTGSGLSSLKRKIDSGSLARIAVVGDSYIEGDIMTQDLRSLLQSSYGGSGVGYMNMHSDFPGFRRSVSQSGNKNWKNYTATKKGKSEYMWLSEQYSNPSGSGIATYKGTKALHGSDSWSTAKFLFVSPNPTTISTKTSGGEWVDHKVEGSQDVQMIEVREPAMTEFSVKASDPSLAALGVWLDGEKGVSVDCMSSRGIPGYSLAKISPELSRQMAKFIDYDLIVLEFGVNAMSSKQKNYDVFTKNMVKVVENLRKCYPNAQFLIMGVGDRGEKKGGQVHSMSTIENMIEAQRLAAQRSGTLFWDTREAMGGEDAIVEWSKTGRANKDYIHLTHKGGASLAKELYNSIENLMK